MGWSQQGYNGKSCCWEVEGYTSGLNPEIEKFHRKKMDLKEYQNTRIIFGTTGEQFFRGYIFSEDENIVKEVLNKFNGFLVYASKYGDNAHEFKLKNLTFFNFKEVILFLERTIFWDFEWEEFKRNIKWSLDFDNVGKETKNKIMEMKIPEDYLVVRKNIENEILKIGRENIPLIKEIINSISREDLRIELNKKYKL